MRHALRYALAIAWVITIGTGCFTAGLLIGHSAAESDSYGIYVLLSAVVATAAIVTAIFLSITSVSRAGGERIAEARPIAEAAPNCGDYHILDVSPCSHPLDASSRLP